jgi:ApaG protein
MAIREKLASRCVIMSNSGMRNNPVYNIRVSIETSYIPEQSIPDQCRYVFAYTITIANTGTAAARLLRRHWIITDANNKVQEVHGDGVVGQQPHLLPGEVYQYTSGAVLETPVGCMQGTYDMLADDGVEFAAAIPLFSLTMPKALH